MRVLELGIVFSVIFLLTIGLSLINSNFAYAEVGTVESYQKIDSLGKWFGQSVASIGDLDGDGIVDLAVGSHADLDGVSKEGMCTSSVGAVWILFLEQDGAIKSKQKISATEGNLPNILVNCSKFGKAVTGLGDLNKDGIEDIAVSTDQAIGTIGREIWILFLNEDGTVKNSKNLSSSLSTSEDRFWQTTSEEITVTNIGDLNNDGIQEIGIGSAYSRVDKEPLGSVWVVSLDKEGNVVSYKKITSNTGGLNEKLGNNNRFGSAISTIGDVNKDGITDIAVGQRLEDDGSNNQGAVWILFLNENGSVKDYQKISSKHGNFKGGLWENAQFGKSISKLGDIDGDAIPDIAVGSFDSIWILFLNGDGTVKSHQKISSLEGNFTGNIEEYDYFGESIGVLSSDNLDQSTTIIVGSPRHGYESPREDSGAVWLLDLHTNQISDFPGKSESLEELELGDLVQSSSSTQTDGFEYEKISPAKQIYFGVLPEDVKCRESLVLVLKSSSNSPACVKPETISKLIERGWAEMTRPPARVFGEPYLENVDEFGR